MTIVEELVQKVALIESSLKLQETLEYLDSVSGGVTGSGAAGRVAFWSAVSALTSDAQFTFSTVDNSLTVDKINLADAANQAVFQSGGITGTLTWTPATSNKTITLPNLTGTVPLGAGTLSYTSTDDITTDNHTHAITKSSDGTANPSTMTAFDASGRLTVSDLYTNDGGEIGIASNERLVFNAAGTIAVTGADLSLPTGLGLTHADGVTAGEFLRANGTRYVPSGFYIAGTAAQTYTFPATGGTLPVGTGTIGRIAEWVTNANTLQASTLEKSGAGVLTLSAVGAYTLTVGATSAINQDVQTTASPTFANAQITDGGYVGISADVRTKYDSTNGFIDHILGDAVGSDKVRVVDSAGTPVQTTDSDGNGYFAGRVGVGTTSAQKQFHIEDADAPTIAIRDTTNNYFIRVGAGNSAAAIDFTGAAIYYQLNTGGISGGFTGTNLMALFSSGNLAIGTTTDNGYRFDVSNGAMRYAEMTSPTAPAANSLVQYAEDASGVTVGRIKFSSGHVVTIARDGGLATYTPTNVTTDRSYDADTVLVAELADVVGTLIADLQAAGVLG